MTRPDPTPETILTLCAEFSLPGPDPYSQDWVAELPQHYRSADWVRRYIAKAAENSLDRASQLVLLDLCLDSINSMLKLKSHEPEATVLWECLQSSVPGLHEAAELLDYWACWDDDDDDIFCISTYVRAFLAGTRSDSTFQEQE